MFLLFPYRINEPSLFTELKIQFYYVPLSEVSTATEVSLKSAPHHHHKFSDSADHLVQPLVEGMQPLLYGEDVWLGCFVGNMDSWYERNVLLTTHNLLRIIPSVSSTTWSSVFCVYLVKRHTFNISHPRIVATLCYVYKYHYNYFIVYDFC